MSNLLVQLQQAHTSIQNQFDSKKEDEKLAKDLEIFFNNVIYNEGNLNDISTGMKDVLREDIAKKIQAMGLDVYLNEGENAHQIGVHGEQTFAKIIEEILINNYAYFEQEYLDRVQRKTIKEIYKLLTRQGAKTSSSGKTTYSFLVSGQSQSATVLSSDKEDPILKKLKEEYPNMFVYDDELCGWRTNARSGKADIDTTLLLQFKGYFNPKVQKLLDLTASVKNYSDFTVHLEEVRNMKAYASVLASTATDWRESSDRLNAVQNYYYQHLNKTNQEVTEHLYHVINLYALTGYGAALLNNINIVNTLEKNYARFIFFNHRKRKKIIVKSTADIISQSVMNYNKNENLNEVYNPHGRTDVYFNIEKNLFKYGISS